MPLYKTVKGKQVKISSREAKATIMRAHDWTEEEYRKNYDVFKLKVRSYEAFRRDSGADVRKQSPQELLYKQAKTMLRYGSDYKPTAQMQNIEMFPAYNKSKREALGKSQKSYDRLNERLRSNVVEHFDDLIKKNSIAQDIVANVRNASELLASLERFAEDFHDFQKYGKVGHGKKDKVEIDGEEWHVDEYGEVMDYYLEGEDPFPEAEVGESGGGSDPTNYPYSWKDYLV